MRFQLRPPFQCLSISNSGKPVLRSSWTISVHHTWCGQPSRRLSRPVVWSIWLSINTIALMPVSRNARPGCIGAKPCNCARMSGEALHSTQLIPSSDSAMDDWVRAWARRLPSRKPAQLTQLQFHWGNPPPAAEPRIWMYMTAPGTRSEIKNSHNHKKSPGEPRLHSALKSTACEVHGDFKTDTQISVSRFSPRHKNLLG